MPLAFSVFSDKVKNGRDWIEMGISKHRGLLFVKIIVFMPIGCNSSKFNSKHPSSSNSESLTDENAPNQESSIENESDDITTQNNDISGTNNVDAKILSKGYSNFMLVGSPGSAHQLSGCSPSNLEACNQACPEGYEARGAIGDCGMMAPPFVTSARFACFGNRFYCRKPPIANSEIVTDIKTEIDRSCTAGYESNGEFSTVDRDQPYIQHTYRICAKKALPKQMHQNQKIITDVLFTSSAIRTPEGESCPPGYEVAATFLDCGNATQDSQTFRDCSGHQRLCILREAL